jgi:hypothetical protein
MVGFFTKPHRDSKFSLMVEFMDGGGAKLYDNEKA